MGFDIVFHQDSIHHLNHYQMGLTRLAAGSAQEKLSRYLAEHLDEILTNETICRDLSLSRTGLYYLRCV